MKHRYDDMGKGEVCEFCGRGRFDSCHYQEGELSLASLAARQISEEGFSAFIDRLPYTTLPSPDNRKDLWKIQFSDSSTLLLHIDTMLVQYNSQRE